MKQQAYEFFLNALKNKLIAVMHQMDAVDVESDQYDQLTNEQIRLQGLLSSLDQIANAV